MPCFHPDKKVEVEGLQVWHNHVRFWLCWPLLSASVRAGFVGSVDKAVFD